MAEMVKELREKTGAGMLDCKKALEATGGNMEQAIDWLRENGFVKAAKKQSRIAAEGKAAILVKENQAVIVEVNSETDFVAKNEQFTDLVNTVLEVILNSNVESVEEALQIDTEDGTLENMIMNKTAKIGEKLSLRRFMKIEKTDTQVFGEYIHMGGKIAVLTVLEGTDSSVARDVAMHAAAMRPSYVRCEDIPTDIIEKEKTVLKEQAMNEGKPEEIASKMVTGRIQKFYKEVCLEEQPFIKDNDIDVKTFVKNHQSSIVTMIRYEVGEGMEKKCENFAEEVQKQMGE